MHIKQEKGFWPRLITTVVIQPNIPGLRGLQWWETYYCKYTPFSCCAFPTNAHEMLLGTGLNPNRSLLSTTVGMPESAQNKLSQTQPSSNPQPSRVLVLKNSEEMMVLKDSVLFRKTSKKLRKTFWNPTSHWEEIKAGWKLPSWRQRTTPSRATRQKERRNQIPNRLTETGMSWAILDVPLATFHRMKGHLLKPSHLLPGGVYSQTKAVQGEKNPQRKKKSAYSWLLNNTGLNCMGHLHTFFQ